MTTIPTVTPNAVLFIRHLSENISGYVGVIAFGFIVVIWIAYTIIGIYHWLRYAHRSFAMIPLIALHFFISLSLIAYAWSGLT
ncbi:hypothetical protein MNBD_CPR01-4 [hydrothermal vent metagenome]|uniref:Uncharacterized protein n=1 Tax=hydrothermal vent metagenome TaxID=652676 RepID=A0A3B0VL04_9ZZZZ